MALIQENLTSRPKFLGVCFLDGFRNTYGGIDDSSYCGKEAIDVSIIKWIQNFSADAVNLEDFLPFGIEIYCSDLPPVAKGLAKDCTTWTCLPDDPFNMSFEAGKSDRKMPEAVFFAMRYLSVRDLLSVERVCKSLRDELENNPLVWRNIRIDHYPLNVNITDDILISLTNRAQGTLQSLTLVECINITAPALEHIFEANPGLSDVYVVLFGQTFTLNQQENEGPLMEKKSELLYDDISAYPTDVDSRREISYEDTADHLSSYDSASKMNSEDAADDLFNDDMGSNSSAEHMAEWIEEEFDRRGLGRNLGIWRSVSKLSP